MPFIGNQPTAVPLSGADLSDGIITSSKIANDAITTGKIANGAIIGDDINSTFDLSGKTVTGIGGLSTSSDSIIKAWVKWTGTTIGDSYNVSSVTNPSTGGYTINFTDSMDNANFATVASLYGQNFPSAGFELEAQATGSTTLRAKNFSNNVATNMGGGGYGCCIVIGDNASL